MTITKIISREVLDSRGNPTVESELWLDNGHGKAICPSGASTGEKEAVELRDGDPSRYGGKGVLNAVSNVNNIIAAALKGKHFSGQEEFDRFLIDLDGTDEKSNLGANAILSVSMAFARASAKQQEIPLYSYLNTSGSLVLPVPCMNVINGGKHADNNIDFQEFMIAPHNAPTFREAIRMGEETFHSLKSILNKKGYFTGVGDEGGFAPNLRSNEETIEVILEAIHAAGYKPGQDISICLDPATSEMWQDGKYCFFKSTKELVSSEQLLNTWKQWLQKYPIISLEDGMGENDWDGWKSMTEELGQHTELIGDDILCTNPKILQKAIDEKVANSILIKPNQIGTVWETLNTVQLAYQNNYGCFISHRSGETEDTFIADLAVATGAGKLKTGSGCRSERISKFNRLLRIEDELGTGSQFAGIAAFKNNNI
ncbi:phosphopyruvate hydratase [Chryseobacterium sp. Y16C]|uniref:phosphopyruvate hydratase n=1 Tax=Chryseobacterium sp. Y16C TaxID=2920939 RepID=UPI001F0AD4CD|nr:phosphopyruvate hydratase [Chryseobacterium sp. Y16C]UMQ43156.1 phosphopyruvate hydratase [Chryseobacterium sp. Y16C]